MTAKEFLSQNRRLSLRIKSKLDRLEEMRAIAEKATASLTGLPRSTTPGSHTEAVIAQIVDMEEDYAADLNNLLQVRAAILAAIRAVPDPDCEVVLDMRYIQQLSWNDIAEELGYSVRNVTRIHGAALKMVRVPDYFQKSSEQCQECPEVSNDADAPA